MNTYDPNDLNACFSILLTQLGAALSLGLCAIGGAYGTAKTGVGIASISNGTDELAGDSEQTKLMDYTKTRKEERSLRLPIWKNLLPVIISGVIVIYGLIMAVIITANQEYTLAKGFQLFGAGLTMGICGLASGVSIGYIGQGLVQASSKDSKAFMPLILVLIFAEAIGLYGLIVSLLTVSHS